MPCADAFAVDDVLFELHEQALEQGIAHRRPAQSQSLQEWHAGFQDGSQEPEDSARQNGLHGAVDDRRGDHQLVAGVACRFRLAQSNQSQAKDPRSAREP